MNAFQYFSQTTQRPVSGLATSDWAPQLGTVEHPKLPGVWPSARHGDVVKIGDELFVAKRQVSLESLDVSQVYIE